MPKAFKETTDPLPSCIDNIPMELRTKRHWVCSRDGMPFNPNTGELAKCNDSNTWGSFNRAWDEHNEYGNNVAFALTEKSGIIGFDLDGCRNAETGELSATALEICELLNSYTEVSPSGKGLRIFVKGKIERSRNNQKQRIEVYNKSKFLTVTGRRLPQFPETIE